MDKSAPFFVGRPVTPIVWNSAKKRVPLVRETPEGGGSSEGDRSPTTLGTPGTLGSPNTPGRDTRQLNATLMEPFSKDPLPLNDKMNFSLKKDMINARLTQRAMSATKKRQEVNAKMKGVDKEDLPFSAQQLCGVEKACWTPQMQKKMSKIFSLAAMSVYQSPIAKSRELDGSRPCTATGNMRVVKSRPNSSRPGSRPVSRSGGAGRLKSPSSRPGTSHGRMQSGGGGGGGLGYVGGQGMRTGAARAADDDRSGHFSELELSVSRPSGGLHSTPTRSIEASIPNHGGYNSPVVGFGDEGSLGSSHVVQFAMEKIDNSLNVLG